MYRGRFPGSLRCVHGRELVSGGRWGADAERPPLGAVPRDLDPGRVRSPQGPLRIPPLNRDRGSGPVVCACGATLRVHRDACVRRLDEGAIGCF